MRLWIIFVCLTVNFSLSCVSKIKLDIFYESLCPDSIRFLSTQLQPIYEQFKRQLDITLIPFGKSSSFQRQDGSIDFECQHGPNECFGNKIQGCMLSRLRDQDLQVAYVTCQMQFTADGINADHQRCVEAFGVNYNEILQCAASQQATEQQLGYEKITLPVLQNTNWVPSVLYNGQITEYTSAGRAGVPLLLDILCQLCSNNNAACQQQRHV